MNDKIRIILILCLAILGFASLSIDACFEKAAIFHQESYLKNNYIQKLLVGKNNQVIKKAIEFSYLKHYGQIRKVDSSLYFYHPVRVAYTVLNNGGSTNQVIAALLHDTLEDTSATYNEIRKIFGKEVANLVRELTTNKLLSQRYGKVHYLSKKINRMSSEAFFIKLCDRLDNVSDLIIADPSFAIRYSKETRHILENLIRSVSDKEKEIIDQIISNLIAE